MHNISNAMRALTRLSIGVLLVTAPSVLAAPPKRTAPPKISPLQALSGMLSLNRYVAGDNLAQTCRRSDFKGLAVALKMNEAWLARPQGEFETSEEYSSRAEKLAAALGKIGQLVICQPLHDNPDALMVYHADERKFSGVFQDYQNVWRDSKELGSYRTRTRIGVPVTVSASAQFDYDAAFEPFSVSHGCLTGKGYYVFNLPYPIADAPALKQGSYLAFIGSLVAPYVRAQNQSGEPTLDDPNDVKISTIAVHAKASRIVLVDAAGKEVWNCAVD